MNQQSGPWGAGWGHAVWPQGNQLLGSYQGRPWLADWAWLRGRAHPGGPCLVKVLLQVACFCVHFPPIWEHRLNSTGLGKWGLGNPIERTKRGPDSSHSLNGNTPVSVRGCPPGTADVWGLTRLCPGTALCPVGCWGAAPAHPLVAIAPAPHA